MPAECMRFSGACAIRTTLVDECGSPIEGDCSQFVTDAFTSVSLTPNVEEADENVLKNACGEICAISRTCPELKFIDVEMEFCEIDPQMFALITGQREYLSWDGQTVVGFGTGEKIRCDAGFALEVWARIPRVGCPDGSAGRCWGYILLPWVVNAIAGDMTFENDNLTFSISGETRADHQWGRGPYDVVEQDGEFTPGPLDPFGRVGVSEGDHRLIQRTCIQPPEPTCGCQPLSILRPECDLVFTSDADGDGTFTSDSTADSSGENVPFEITVSNEGDDDGLTESLRVTDNRGMVVDLIAGTVTGAPGVTVVSMCTGLTEISAGAPPTTCQFTLQNYSPPEGESRRLTLTAVFRGETYGFTDQCTSVSNVDTPALATVAGGGSAGYVEGPSGSGAGSTGSVSNVDCDGGANGTGQGFLSVFGLTSDGGTWSVVAGTITDGDNAWDAITGATLVGSEASLTSVGAITGAASNTTSTATFDFGAGYVLAAGSEIDASLTLEHDASGSQVQVELAAGTVESCDPV